MISRFFLCFLTLAPGLFAQRELSGAAEIKLALDQLNTVGSVLMIAAHPDDEIQQFLPISPGDAISTRLTCR